MKRLAEFCAWALMAGAAHGADCAVGVLDIRDPDTNARFQIELMDSDEERARGLMFRKSMPRFSGMLFVYETAQPVAFWMENTEIPLDMLFFDAAGRLKRIHENARPMDRTPILGGDDIRFVLEVNAGVARLLDIDIGAELRHPAVDPAIAAWACGAD